MKQRESCTAETVLIRLLMSIAIIAAIMILVSVGWIHLQISLDEHQVEQECHRLEAILSTMVESGVSRDLDEVNSAEGTKRIVTLSLPESLLYVSLGGDPDPFNNGILTSNLTENGASIFFKITGGSKHVIWLPEQKFQFREGTYYQNKWIIKDEGNSFIIHPSQTTLLIFELIQKNDKVYILIHGNDDINP